MEGNRFICSVIILFLVLSGICFGQDATTQATPRYQEVNGIDKDIADKCKEESRVTCDEMCVDGFGQDCYFDSTQYSKAKLKSDEVLPEETKAACFAIRSYSECGSCYKKFELKESGGFKEVSCEEFYQAIKKRNKNCNNCVDVLYAGCC